MAQIAAQLLNEGLLRKLFQDTLGRPPLSQERSSWLGKESSELVYSIVGKEEFWRNWLEEQLYYFLLVDNFRPTAESIQALSDQLSRESLGALSALHRICISTSFDRRNPGPDTFVTVVMEQLLGMTVLKNPRELEIGKAVYDGARGKFLGVLGSSQADVLRIALDDQRTTRHLLKREHQRLLREEPTENQLREWSSALEQDEHAFAAFVANWLASPAYDRRLQCRWKEPNRLFVRGLFVDLFDRVPDETETQRIRSALDGMADSGPLRSLVARLLLDSGRAHVPERSSITDPTSWITGLFERMLGRAPSAEEQRVFVEAFGDPACRPATVVYSIASHPEYQTW